MRARNTPLAILALLLAGAVVLAPGCSSDSPSEPSQPTPQPPGGGGGASFVITVTAVPGTIEAGGAESATIRVQVRRTDNNQPPPDGTTVVVATSAGNLGSPTGPSSAVIDLTGGVGAIPLFPPADPGTAVVQAQLQGSVGQTTVEFAAPDTFFVAFVEPAVGSPQGGDQVTIHGSGFEAPVRVLFGAGNAQVVSVSSSQIRVITPPSPAAGNQQSVVAVSVTINVNEVEEATDTLAGGFTYSPGGSTQVPAVFSVTPGAGPNEGGTVVVITGEGFSAPVQVIFGQGTPDNFQGQEAQIRSVTSTRIEVLSPAALGFGQDNQNQTVAILVRNLGSGLASVRPSAFQYGTPVLITSVGPTIVPYFGGVLVTIFGQGFDAPVAVSLGGIAQPATSVTGTEIVVATQAITTNNCADVTGGVGVVNLETGDGDEADVDFTYRVEAFTPVIFGINPPSGPQAGNTLVTITGSDLRSPRVEFGGRPAVVTTVAADGSSVTARTPFLPDEALRTEACDDNMDGTQGQRFLSTAVDVTVINRDTTCEDTFEDGFVYNPTNTTCRNDVGPPPPPP